MPRPVRWERRCGRLFPVLKFIPKIEPGAGDTDQQMTRQKKSNVLLLNPMYKRNYAYAYTPPSWEKTRLTLDQGDTRPDQPASPIPHTRRSPLRPVPLHPRKRVLYMLRPQWRPGLRRGQKQRTSR